MNLKPIFAFLIVFIGLCFLIGFIFLSLLAHNEGTGWATSEFFANYLWPLAEPGLFIAKYLAKLSWMNYWYIPLSIALNALLYTAFIVWLFRIWNQRKSLKKNNPS